MLKTRVLVWVIAFGVCLCVVDARADMVDLTASGSGTGTINGAVFNNVTRTGSGSGILDSFVRIHSNDPTEQGYNTDHRPLEYDENNSSTFTHALSLSAVPIVDLGGTLYREFLLDINEDEAKKSEDYLLSLDTIEIYLAGSGSLTGHPTFGGQATLIYNLIPGSQDNWILLDASMSTGSGTADMYAYIPNALFDLPGDFVYLYSHFGTHVPNSGGFEEWGVEKFQDSSPLVPVPAAAILGMFGLSVAGWRLRRYA